MARSVKNGGWERAAESAESYEMHARHLAADILRDSDSAVEKPADRELMDQILTKASFDPKLWNRRQWGHETVNFAQFAICEFQGTI